MASSTAGKAKSPATPARSPAAKASGQPALSELVSHKTAIDSLFLDEGFGTLDADTLEIALNALDTLTARSKMIGAISHVEGMKKRIPAQIRIEKGRRAWGFVVEYLGDGTVPQAAA